MDGWICGRLGILISTPLPLARPLALCLSSGTSTKFITHGFMTMMVWGGLLFSLSFYSL